MNAKSFIQKSKVDDLKEQAVERLNKSIERIKDWVWKVRAEDQSAGKFRWSVETTRSANIAATAYILGGLKSVGLFDSIITEEDKKEGVAWVNSLCIGNEQYRDPALFDRRTPGWPDNEPWPTPAMQVSVNQYSQNILKTYLGKAIPPSPPPKGWPQSDEPEKAVEWIKTRPWNTDTWGAGSHGMRMATWLLQWYKEGKIPIEPLIQALKFFYEIQDPETGLWGNDKVSKYVRINGTFKLFPLIREQ